MKGLHVVAFILLIIGGLNWLLYGINMDWNLVAKLPGGVAQVIYILVGLAAVVEIFTHKSTCKACTRDNGMPQGMGM